ncbi:MAG: hypothetical protein AAFW68_12585, partial [Pseudomonadota bacterium]
LSISLVPLYAQADSIINLVQQLNGLLSMPILSAFFIAIFFRNVSPWAAGAAVIAGSISYGVISFFFSPFHYIHMMFVILMACMALALLINRLIFKRKAVFTLEDFRRTDQSVSGAIAPGA